MGYLPIFVALSGLVLLYSLYTYNQIKPKKAALTLVIDQMAKISSERKNIILTYDRANDNSVLNEAAADLMKTSTDRFQSFRKENELITKTNEGASNLSDVEKDLKDFVENIYLVVESDKFLTIKISIKKNNYGDSSLCVFSRFLFYSNG